MRGFVLGAAALFASSALAFAGDEVLAGYFGNTIISKGAMGEARVHYRADHTFDGTASSELGSMQLKGIWRIDDKDQLCRTYNTPPPGVSNPLCTPVEAHKAGDTWTTGGRTISLVQGIQ